MADRNTRRQRRRHYSKPLLLRRRRLAEVTEGNNIFVTGRIT